ncbi:MAG: MspA family porin [Nocardiaceae bacterium]|nr:MspA family porin [Nocardiaceae bacterium]
MNRSDRAQRFGALALGTLALSSVIGFGAITGSGEAAAAIDGRASIVDFYGDKLTAILKDFQVDFYPPLDGGPTTREWFINGTVGYNVVGPKAGGFEGKLTFGYQVGYPGTFDGTIQASWTSPSLTYSTGSTTCSGGTCTSPTQPIQFSAQLIPQATAALKVGLGPGIVDIPVGSGNVKGSAGAIRLQGFHGTVKGVLGRVNLRPYVKLESTTGDTVIAYGRVYSEPGPDKKPK